MVENTWYTVGRHDGAICVRSAMDTMNVVNFKINLTYDDRVKPLIDKLYSYECYREYTGKDYDDIVKLVTKILDIDKIIIQEIANENNISFEYAEAYYYRFRDIPIKDFLNRYSEDCAIHNGCPRGAAVYHAANGISGYY